MLLLLSEDFVVVLVVAGVLVEEAVNLEEVAVVIGVFLVVATVCGCCCF